MPYYVKCTDCGSNNDPGESCDCRNKKETAPSDRRQPQENELTVILPAEA